MLYEVITFLGVTAKVRLVNPKEIERSVGKAKRIIDKHEWHDGQFAVRHFIHVLEEAAQRRISINTHEPVKDTGLRRTYPNWLAREGARGQEFNAFGVPPNDPEHTTVLPYTRMLAGPMDFTPGIFQMRFERGGVARQMPTTLAKQLRNNFV